MREIDALSPPHVIGIASQIGQSPGLGLLVVRFHRGSRQQLIHRSIEGRSDAGTDGIVDAG